MATASLELQSCLACVLAALLCHEADEDQKVDVACAARSQAAAAATALAAGAVRGDRGDILDAADLHAGAGERAEGALGARARRARLRASRRAQLDVQRADAQLLAPRGHVLGRKHR